MITEADTCRKYVLPKLIEAGWDDEPHSFTEQKSCTHGRILGARDLIPIGKGAVFLMQARYFIIKGDS
jgi:type I restriction enzyme R subunit